jgi:hypothetical protein
MNWPTPNRRVACSDVVQIQHPPRGVLQLIAQSKGKDPIKSAQMHCWHKLNKMAYILLKQKLPGITVSFEKFLCNAQKSLDFDK